MSSAAALPVVSAAPQMPSRSSRYLEAEPERLSEFGPARCRVVTGAAEQGAGPGGEAYDGRRLAGDHGQVVGGGDVGAPLEAEIERLAGDDGDCHAIEGREQPQGEGGGDAPLGQRVERKVRRGEEGIACVDRLPDPPQAPHRRPVPARRTLILHVVVTRREVMEQLDRGGERRRAPPAAPRCTGGEERDSRRHAFAAIAPVGCGLSRFACP